MASDRYWPWSVLGIDATDDVRAVQRRYAVLLKTIDQSTELAKFENLNNAFKAARSEAKARHKAAQAADQRAEFSHDNQADAAENHDHSEPQDAQIETKLVEDASSADTPVNASHTSSINDNDNENEAESSEDSDRKYIDTDTGTDTNDGAGTDNYDLHAYLNFDKNLDDVIETVKHYIQTENFAVNQWLRLLNDPVLDFTENLVEFEKTIVDQQPMLREVWHYNLKSDQSKRDDFIACISLLNDRFSWLEDGIELLNRHPKSERFYDLISEVLAQQKSENTSQDTLVKETVKKTKNLPHLWQTSMPVLFVPVVIVIIALWYVNLRVSDFLADNLFGSIIVVAAIALGLEIYLRDKYPESWIFKPVVKNFSLVAIAASVIALLLATGLSYQVIASVKANPVIPTSVVYGSEERSEVYLEDGELSGLYRWPSMASPIYRDDRSQSLTQSEIAQRDLIYCANQEDQVALCRWGFYLGAEWKFVISLDDKIRPVAESIGNWPILLTRPIGDAADIPPIYLESVELRDKVQPKLATLQPQSAPPVLRKITQSERDSISFYSTELDEISIYAAEDILPSAQPMQLEIAHRAAERGVFPNKNCAKELLSRMTNPDDYGWQKPSYDEEGFLRMKETDDVILRDNAEQLLFDAALEACAIPTEELPLAMVEKCEPIASEPYGSQCTTYPAENQPNNVVDIYQSQPVMEHIFRVLTDLPTIDHQLDTATLDAVIEPILADYRTVLGYESRSPALMSCLAARGERVVQDRVPDIDDKGAMITALARQPALIAMQNDRSEIAESVYAELLAEFERFGWQCAPKPQVAKRA